MARHVFTIVTTIANRPEAEDTLRAALAAMQRSLNANQIIDFNSFSELHFASFVIAGDTLVFENSVTGNRNAYLDRLATLANLDAIYQHCEDYPALPTTAAERSTYLRRHLQKPNLRHVSTPDRTVDSIKEDAEIVRRVLEPRARMPVTRLLIPSVPPPAVGENWNWEVLKPYVAILGTLLWFLWEWYLWRQPRLSPWWDRHSVVLALDMLIPGLLGVFVLVKTWRTTPDVFRTRALSVIFRAIWLIGLLVLLWRSGASHWIRALALLAVAAAVVASLVNEIARWKTERMAALRQAMSIQDAVNCWDRLKRAHRVKSPHPYAPERACVWERLWNWKWWVIIPAVTIIAVWGLRRYDLYSWMYRGLLVAFAVEAIWLTILVGWPPIALWSRARLTFIAVAVATAWLVLESLSILDPHPVWLFDWHPVIYGWVVIITWFALQALTLAAPDVEVAPPSDAQQQTIERVTAQEDCGVQNHMALAAHVGDSWIRRGSLRIFLWSLDKIFYRALLPDVYRGRLFGIPTVHSAQWVLLDDGRYLFLSNYDHSFTTYLDDFGTQIPSGIQKIWGICHGNPGMQDVERFKLFVRKAMVPHQVWYRAYPALSVRQIWNNERIRLNLAFDDGTEERMIATLRRFGGAPKIVPGITHAAQ